MTLAIKAKRAQQSLDPLGKATVRVRVESATASAARASAAPAHYHWLPLRPGPADHTSRRLNLGSWN